MSMLKLPGLPERADRDDVIDVVIGRMDELREGFYVTLVPEHQVKATKRGKK